MNIAIEAQRIFRKKKHGMDFVALETIRQLQKLPLNDTLFVYVKKGPDVCLQSTDRVIIKELPSYPYPIWEQITLPRALKKDNCKMLHCTSNTAPLNPGVPLITTIHDVIYLEPKTGKGMSLYQKLGFRYRKWNVPIIANKSKWLITVSNYEKTNLQKHFPNHTNVKVIYNGVGEHFHPINDTDELENQRKKYHLPKEFFLFLGNTDPKKNTQGVLKAFHLYKQKNKDNIKLVMPDLSPRYLQSILGKFKNPQLMEHIHLTGYIPNSVLPYFYNLSKAFLYPSLRESFGIPILEALKCGVPVITSNITSMPEIASSYAIQINPANPQEIAAQLEKLTPLSSEKKNAQIVYASEFSWKNTALKTLELYYKVLSESNE